MERSEVAEFKSWVRSSIQDKEFARRGESPCVFTGARLLRWSSGIPGTMNMLAVCSVRICDGKSILQQHCNRTCVQRCVAQRLHDEATRWRKL